MIAYADIGELVKALNSATCRYVVLRNYQELLSGSMLDDKHPDIDILTDNAPMLVDALCAKASHSDKRYGDGVHYYVMVANRKVSIDLRSVGDGYYCPKWESEILERRVLCGIGNQPVNKLYIPDDKDSLYTLLYHSIFQKAEMSDDYKVRLTKMSRRQGVITTEFGRYEWVNLLESFMRDNGYRYTYCTDYHVPLRRRWIDKKLTDLNWRLGFIHIRYDFKLLSIEIAVKLKHALHL